jgi:hypothetical protein
MNHPTVNVETDTNPDTDEQLTLFQRLMDEHTDPEEAIEAIENGESGEDGEFLQIPVYARKGEQTEAVKAHLRELIDD